MTQPLTGFAAPLVSTGQIGQVQVRMTEFGSLAVDQVKGAGDEQTRAGQRYHGNALGGGVTGIAPVQALMTTAAQWLIWNPPASTVTAYFDRLAVVALSGTVGAGGALFACLVITANAPATPVTTSVTGTRILNAAASSAKTSALLLGASKTLVNTDASSWIEVARMGSADTVLGQTTIDTGFLPIQGCFSIGPGTGLALCVISPTGTSPLFTPLWSHREYPTLQQ